MSTFSAISSVVGVNNLSNLSLNATSSGAVASAPAPTIPSMGWSDDITDISFGFGTAHCEAAVDTSGLAQYNGGESNSIAATSEYVQQQLIYEAALSIVVHGSVSAPVANHLLRDGY